MKTLFIDIDGTILKHQGTFSDISLKEATLLPNARERMNEWCSKEYKIILTTARRESMRHTTELQLNQLGVPYDQLVMGLKNHPRVLINDDRDGMKITAYARTLARIEGIPTPALNLLMDI